MKCNKAGNTTSAPASRTMRIVGPCGWRMLKQEILLASAVDQGLGLTLLVAGRKTNPFNRDRMHN